MASPLTLLFREEQNQIIHHKSGKLAIIAVPGSGKTFTLAHLAAQLVSKLSATDLARKREILVVTFSNSAAITLQNRIAQITGNTENKGYRVRTLHGLAHDLLVEHAEKIGLPLDFRILDEQISRKIIRDVTDHQLKTRYELFETYIASSIRANESRLQNVYTKLLPDLASHLSERFIRYCKDRALTPENILAFANDNPLLEFATKVYEEYQQRLTYLSAVDFDDLVMLALSTVQENDALRSKLQKRWTFILEDEAQDSTSLQEKLLRLLSADKNWVRVGDPNQAINSTFTTADPAHLRAFAEESDVETIPLTHSGRSGRPIIDLANALAKWTVDYHPVDDLQSTFIESPIRPVSIGDLQPNPSINETNVHIHIQPGKDISPEDELRTVVKSLQRWLPENKDKTVAILVPDNRHGYRLTDLLRQEQLPYEELLRTSSDTRQVIRALLAAFSYFSEPTNARSLSQLYLNVWNTYRTTQGTAQLTHLSELAQAIARYSNVEDFIYPSSATKDAWLLAFNKIPQATVDDFVQFQNHLRQWLDALYLPADQLLLWVSRDLFHSPEELATSYKVAAYIRELQNQSANAHMGLFQVVEALKEMNEKQHRIFDIHELTPDFEPTPGTITVSTIHASKGLEWDRVYVLGINNHAFPSIEEHDEYVGEKWFIRDQLDLEAELKALVDTLVENKIYEEGEATRASRIAYASERLRLLYVAITRAKQELILLWNNGYRWKSGQTAAEPALALQTLHEYLSGSLSL